MKKILTLLVLVTITVLLASCTRPPDVVVTVTPQVISLSNPPELNQHGSTTIYVTVTNYSNTKVWSELWWDVQFFDGQEWVFVHEHRPLLTFTRMVALERGATADRTGGFHFESNLPQEGKYRIWHSFYTEENLPEWERFRNSEHYAYAVIYVVE